MMNSSVIQADCICGPLFNTPQNPVNEKTDPQSRREEILAQSPAEKCEYTRTVSVNVDGYRVGMDFIENLIQRSKRTKKPGGLWLLGSGGQGKSFILEKIFNRHAPIENEEARYCPLIYMTFSSRPNKINFYTSILLQLGQNPDLISYKSAEDLENIVVDALQQCQTLAMLFDESQHLWLLTSDSRKSDRMGGIMGDTLKLLYDRTGLAYIFSGTPGLEVIINKDPQARTRWLGVHKLHEFEFDQKFLGLLEALDEALPLPEKAGFAKYFSQQLFDACKANFRILKTILAEAVFIAATNNSKKITREHLEQAYFLVTCSPENPFAKK